MTDSTNLPIVSFCMTTYKRPEMLKEQLVRLRNQSFPGFTVIISDNDPDRSAEHVVAELDDKRFCYYPNNDNLGMIKSFNKSIIRANTQFVVMITDDDPVDDNFLSEMTSLVNDNPGYSVYCGFKRTKKKLGEIEIIGKNSFAVEILDPRKTTHIFWTNCLINRNDVISIGCIPNYEGLHLADHALLALAGSVNGAVVINKIYSTLNVHNSNFSRQDLNTYYNGCTGFYTHMTSFFNKWENAGIINKVIIKHLINWFIIMSFSLRRYFIQKNETEKIKEIDNFSRRILQIDYMKKAEWKYLLKKGIFQIKLLLGLIS